MNNITKTLSTKFITTFGRTGLRLQKYSPEILLGVGIVGAVAATVLACKSTLKVEEIVTETKETLKKIDHVYENQDEVENSSGKYSQEDYLKDKAIVYVQTGVKFAKLYGPALGLGALSIGSILASHGIMQRRNVALIAAYNIVADGFSKYRQNVVDELGPEADKKYRFGATQEEITEEVIDEKGNKTTVKKKVSVVGDSALVSDYARFFDESSVEWQSEPWQNLYFLKVQEKYFNDLLRMRGHVFLNEVYDALGLPRSRAGAIVGWVYRTDGKNDGFIDFDLYNVHNSAKRDFVNGYSKSILLDFNVDGIIYWSI